MGSPSNGGSAPDPDPASESATSAQSPQSAWARRFSQRATSVPATATDSDMSGPGEGSSSGECCKPQRSKIAERVTALLNRIDEALENK